MPTKKAAAIAMVAAIAGLICLPAIANGAPLEEVRISVSTTVDPPHARPAEPITQLARVTNTGSRDIQQLIVELDVGPGCRALIMVLPPDQTATVTCVGTASVLHTLLSATVRSSSPIDGAIYARAVVHIDLLALPDPLFPTSGNPLPPRTPPVPQAAPAAPAAPAPPAAPAAPAAPALPRAAAPPVSLPRAASRPAAPAPGPTANTGPSASRATARLSRRHGARKGPLAEPARYAVVVGLLGVTVMTVSVGALAAALRVR
jgi:hypothetical protein